MMEEQVLFSTKNLIQVLIEYIKLIDVGTSSFDTIEIEIEIQKHQDQNRSKEYFISCTYGILGIYTSYSTDLKKLVDLGNEFCNIKGLNITIFKTTGDGGSALYNHSPLGMILARDVNTDFN